MHVSNPTSVKMVVRVALMVYWDSSVYVRTDIMVQGVRTKLTNVSNNHVQMERNALIRLTILNVSAPLVGWEKRVRLVSLRSRVKICLGSYNKRSNNISFGISITPPGVNDMSNDR